MTALYILLAFSLAFFALSFATPTLRRIWIFHVYASKYLFLTITDLLRIRGIVLRALGKPYTRLSGPRALRLFCEDMGVTFVKLGQVVASSAGLFPERYVLEFQAVLDKVRPFAFSQVQQILQEELGESVEKLSNIDSVPLASASVAQVHSATLNDGTQVVFKVQRPGISKVIHSDTKILLFLAKLSQWLFAYAKIMNAVGIVEDLAKTLAEETDFRKEASNLDEFNQIMEKHQHTLVHAPVPHWELVTSKVLVMERFFGTRIDDVKGIADRGVNAESSLVEGMQAWFQCLVFHGFFHGDLHAGNLMLLDNKDIGFLDFGIVGRFDDAQRYLVTDYIIGFATKDFKKVAETICAMGGVGKDVDLDQLGEDFKKVYGPMVELAFSEINYADIIPKVNAVARKHQMTMPKEFVLITKQLLYFDRYAKLLAPKLNIFTDSRLIMSMMTDIQKVRQEQRV